MKFIVATTALAVAANAEFVVDQNTVNLLIAIVSIIGVVIAVIRYIDHKIDHKIKNYANLVTVQFKLLRNEISNLRELMGHPPLPDESSKDKEG